MSTKPAWKILTIFILLVLSSCSIPPTPGTEQQPIAAPVSTGTIQANMPNPASVYCEQQGNRLEIRTAADGSQAGICIFPDGSECDEWAYYRGECEPHSNTPGSLTPTPLPSSEYVIPQTVPMPAGAIIDPRQDVMTATRSLIFYNKEGLTLGELIAPNALYVHAAGHYQGSLNFPLVFDGFESEGQKHSINLNSGRTSSEAGGGIEPLVSIQEGGLVSGLAGIPGEPLVFYIFFHPAPNGVRSEFVLGPVATISSATPLFTRDSNESRYWKPVAIQVKDNAPSGLWFTRTPWGIGGDIVFPYYEGLSFYDLATGTLREVLPPEVQFNNLSTDQTWAAYSTRIETGNEFIIQDLQGGEPILLPTRPENNRGAGNGIFSPSNRYIAWREAQGSIADNTFRQTTRVATLDGQLTGDYPDVSFYKTAGMNGTVSEIKPVAWLDDENVLIQVTSTEKFSEGKVIKLNIKTADLSLFAQGTFAGLFYP
ncbi:MAG: DUF333 domain-containing protein [Syntrophothermus sp.]